MEKSQYSVKELVVSVFAHPLIIVSLILINLFWGIFGIIAYLPQTNGVSLLFWIFIPDCPLYTILFACFLVDREKMRKQLQPFLWILSLSLIKFSLVAPSLYYLFPSYYHAPPVLGIQLPNIYPFDYFHLFLLGQGLFISAIFLIKSVRNFLIGFGWILLNDFIDFFFLTFPYYYLTQNHMRFFLMIYVTVNIGIFILGLIVLSKNDFINEIMSNFYTKIERISARSAEHILASRIIRQRK
jgi:uncharacterized membrane protein YpjA